MRKQGINGDLITEYRERNKLTQAKFASRLNKQLSENGVTATYSDKAISMWENGNRQPADINVLKALAKTIGVSLDELCFMNEVEEEVQKDTINKDQTTAMVEYLNKFVEDNQQIIFDCYALGMYNCAETIKTECIDVNTIKVVKEFWLSIPFEPLAVDDVVWASHYVWDDGYELFEEYTKGANQVSEQEFRALVLNYLLDNANDLKKNYDENFAVDYVDYRFEGGLHSEPYEKVLSSDLSALGIDVEDVKTYPIADYYTDKGLILRVGVEVTGKSISFVKMLAGNILENSDKWTQANKKSIEELLKTE